MPTIPALFNYHKTLNFLAQNDYLFYIAGGITAGTITILLIIKSLPINYNKHLAYKNTLQKREEILFELKQVAIESQHNDLNSNTKILSLLNQLEHNQQKLEQIPDFLVYIDHKEYSHNLLSNSQEIQGLKEVFQSIESRSIKFNELAKKINYQEINKHRQIHPLLRRRLTIKVLP